MTLAMLVEHDRTITAFARLIYRQFQGRFGGRLPFDEHDFVQIARIGVWRAGEIHEGYDEVVVVRKIIRWRCYDAVREVAGRHERGVLKPIGQRATEEYVPDEADPADDYARAELRIIIGDPVAFIEAVPGLTERERDALLGHVRGERVIDNAARMGISPSRVCQLVAHAQKKARLGVVGFL